MIQRLPDVNPTVFQAKLTNGPLVLAAALFNDGDGLPNLVEYALDFAPRAFSSPNAAVQLTAVPSGANTVFTIVFRRDPRATDLTYRLHTSDNLISWTTIVQSVGGAVPSGTGFISEADAPGESPMKLVTAREILPSAGKRFARLQIVR